MLVLKAWGLVFTVGVEGLWSRTFGLEVWGLGIRYWCFKTASRILADYKP
jgi:hypothetical protein